MTWKILVPGIPAYTNLGFLGFCNIVLIESDGRYGIYDPGHFGNKEYLLNSLKNNGLSTSDIEFVILSHLHYDHSLNSLIFSKAKIYASKREVEYTQNTPDLYSAQYLPTLLNDRLIKVEEGDTLYGLKFILLPGHTAGTLGVIDNDTMLVGDAIKYVNDAKKRETSFAYYNLSAANQSITKALKMGKIIVPGHDLPFKVSESKIEELPNFIYDFIIFIKNDMKISILKT
ncbi:MAG: MBL fold metallo-hydrolase [Thermofilaceae archaeon]